MFKIQQPTPEEIDGAMNLRDQLARVIARDSRYTIESYAFVLESLKRARNHKLKEQRKRRERGRISRSSRSTQHTPSGEAESSPSGHVTGAELCQSARRLALRYYGMMAITVLQEWGIRSTSDIGEIVYNLIAAGDLDKTPGDKRSDFDDVFDFAKALRPKSLLEEEKSR